LNLLRLDPATPTHTTLTGDAITRINGSGLACPTPTATASGSITTALAPTASTPTGATTSASTTTTSCQSLRRRTLSRTYAQLIEARTPPARRAQMDPSLVWAV